MEAKCGCRLHDDLSTGTVKPTLYKLSARKYRKATVRKLVELGHISSRTTYLCSVCAEHGNHLVETEEEGPSTSSPIPPDIRSVIDQINAGTVSEDALIALANALGRSQRVPISVDANGLLRSKCYANLLESDTTSWLQERNAVVVAFTTACSGIGPLTESPRKALAVAASVDCLYSSCVSNLVTPLPFAANLVSYFVCGSKTVCNIMSRLYPCGSYGTVCNWISQSAGVRCVAPSPHDIISFFDNNQVIGRNWRVRVDAKALVSVMTNVIHISPSHPSTIQQDPSLSPANWLYNNAVPPDGVVSRIEAFIQECGEHFEILRKDFLTDRLTSVFEEQSCDEKGGFIDLIDEACASGIFTSTGGKTNFDPYEAIASAHPPLPPSVTMGEPCFRNPCSYQSVQSVLEHLITESGISSGERHWTTVGCDGLPYILGSRLIRDTTHLQNILLVPGLGHFEINMVKTLFRLLWDVGLSDLAKLMGFSSIKAQAVCQAASNHHKSWQILDIFFQGTTSELLLPFVRRCRERATKPTLDDYYRWLGTVKDPNYIFLKDAVLTYTLAVFLFRGGMRRNNSRYILTARTKFSPLFYGMNCTTYQEILYQDLRMRLTSPAPIRSFLIENEAFSVGGHPSRGEGGDFILEARNRRVKMWLPPGIPTDDQWLRVCRNLDKLEKIRSQLDQLVPSAVQDPTTVRLYHPDMTREILRWRCRLRSTAYCLAPEESRVHQSVDGGTIMDHDLVHFHAHCKGNAQIFLQSKLSPDKPNKFIPIFITPNDRQRFRHIDNKTKKEIDTYIHQALQELRSFGALDEADALQQSWERDVRSSTKAVYIAFYKTVLSELEQVKTPTNVNGTDSEDEE